MSAIKVNFEIGHEASLRSKKTAEGFTHDWEVFVRGQEGADISYFVEKVVFLLHETFPKPRRVVKEPPFSVKESGYAGFTLPIEIYLKNKDEPKKIKFSYDLSLQQSGFLKDRYIFQNQNDEFRKKLLKGGGIPISNNAFYTNPDQESRSRDSFTEDKQQVVNKSKSSSENVKKHKSKEHKEEIPLKTSNNFVNLFGPPIQKPPKVSPDPKKIEKSASVKPEKKDKEKSSSEKKSRHEHKEGKPDKVKVKEDKEKNRPDKVKSHHKEERPKEKPSKRQNDRAPSPEATSAKKRCPSPGRRPNSPPPRSNSASSVKEEYKSKLTPEIFDKKPKLEEKSSEIKPEKDVVKEKKKKEKKSHDRDKERKEKKEHKKEIHKSKESPKEPVKELPKEVSKAREVVKEKDVIKEKQQKPEKAYNKFSIENLRKSPVQENESSTENKTKEKSESERKHKHKKKDKKRDESREKHKESNKEKKHKHDRSHEIPPEKPEATDRRETPVPKERSIPEPASPISLDTASQCSSMSGPAKTSQTGVEDVNSSHSDSESSVIAEDEEQKVKIENASPESKREPSPEPEHEPEPEPEGEAETLPEAPPPHKEKSKKHKDKSSKREEKRRKRKAAAEEDLENRKVAKTETAPASNDTEHGESSGSFNSMETKVQDNGVSSSLGEDAEPGDLSPGYMEQLRELQQRIMTIKNNEDLERVVNLIAETGRYEVTTQTFDFDLCLLDRSTVQQLIQLVGC